MKSIILIFIITILLLILALSFQDLIGQQIVRAIDGSRITESQSSTSWLIKGNASGGNYRLIYEENTSQLSSGCCCTYLPCIINTP